MIISIIIPVFNAEKYLDRCLDSVLESLKYSNKKGEILLIDNNSTDGSFAILKRYAKKYPEAIRVLKCETPGAAAVRNYGVLEATGRYIWFVDADDTVAKTAISDLIAEAETSKADLVMMGMERHYPDGHTDYLSAVDSTKKDFKSRFVRYGMGPVQVLIRRAWWIKHGLSFRESIIHEDMELMSALILYTNSLSFVDKPLYHYYQNPESVLHKSKWDSHYFDIFSALSGLYMRFDEAGAVNEYYAELEWFFIWNLLIDSAKDFAKFKEGRRGFKASREMLMQFFPDWRKNKFLRQKSWKLRLKVLKNYFTS